MTTRVVVLVLVVACLVGLVAAAQLLGRAAGALPLEVHLRPLAMVRRRSRATEPADLVTLQHLVKDTLGGDPAAASRLALRLQNVGVALSGTDPVAVRAALQQLLSTPLD